MVKKNSCVFISGKGSNLENLIKKSREYSFPINITSVVTNNNNAAGIRYAKKYSIPYLIVDTRLRNYEEKILLFLRRYNISLICLAGYMKIISRKFLNKYRNKIINIHPSLLPKFKGLNTFSRILTKNEKKTGCTVHHVNDKLDGGNIIVKKSFYIKSYDNVNTLKYKTQKLEYLAFPEAIIKIFK